jgi:hypothetical protein
MSTAAIRRAPRGRLALPVAFMLSACGTPPASDFGGDWTPVNRFPDATSSIPLRPNHAFRATPIDGTLKNLLERWASESGRALSYRLESDFTLHSPVAGIDAAEFIQPQAS